MNNNGITKQIVFFLIFILVVLVAGGAIYYYSQTLEGIGDFDHSTRIKVEGVSFDDVKCATFSTSECPEQCQVCADCQLCTDQRCHGKDFCKALRPDDDLEL